MARFEFNPKTFEETKREYKNEAWKWTKGNGPDNWLANLSANDFKPADWVNPEDNGDESQIVEE